MKNYFIIFIFLTISLSANAQTHKYTISFDTSVINFSRSKDKNTDLMVGLNSKLSRDKNWTNYVLLVNDDKTKTELPQKDFSIIPTEKSFSEIKEKDSIKITFTKDSSTGGPKILYLKLQIKKDTNVDQDSMNDGKFKILKIIVGDYTTAIDSGFSIGFADSKITIVRDKENDVIKPIYIKASGQLDNSKYSNYKVSIFANNDSSTLSPSFYKLDFQEIPFSKLSTTDSAKNVAYLTVKKDSLEDREREIILKLEIFNGAAKDSGNTSKKNKSIVKVEGIHVNDSLKSYNYLAYIGTNFDLVDGKRPKNLFFAANIFIPPTYGKGVGMYLSLYGNRTMTAIDTISGIQRTTKAVTLTDTTYRLFTDKYNLTRSQVSDNLGAYISPLIKLPKVSSRSNQLQLYYSPSLEFVWRRTNITSTYSNSIQTDSTTEKGKFTGGIQTISNSNYDFNEFVFNVGVLGFTLVHESPEISVRVHCTTGYSSTYSPNNSSFAKGSVTQPTKTNYTTYGDIFFSGRAWITESVTGLTLQAEITNTWKYPRPFFGVTLSKAINFKNLGKIFQPIVDR